ncbi:MAG TPA: glycerophosphodiester phosphodiesterase [Chthoniobacteraceae bacterium]|nr:glycerophosphodiester phosphodiesterase [Chthoniobacteraceae bacterium]
MAIFRTRSFLAALLFVAAISSSSLLAVEIIAHRGASYDAPENTFASFKLGWKQNADADELDIWLSKDGKMVVFHDDNTKRIAGVNQRVAEQTFAELRTLDAGIWKGAAWKGERIPTLEEALATQPPRKRMFIEIKCGPEILAELERVLRESGKTPAELVIIGFGYETMKAAKARFPQIPVFWLVSPEKESRGEKPGVEELVAKTKEARLDGLNLNFKFAIDEAFVRHVKGAGLKLYVWTVDDAKVAQRVAGLGVDGITTNRPEWLRAQLAGAAVD